MTKSEARDTSTGDVGKGPYDPRTVIFLPILLPTAAATASAIGTIRGVSESARTHAEQVLTNTFWQCNPVRKLTNHLFSIGRQKTSWRWEWLCAPSQSRSIAGGAPPPEDGQYQLTIAALAAELAPVGAANVTINPRLRLRVRVSVEVIRARDRQCLFYQSWEEGYGWRHFTRWADENGRPLRDGLDRCIARLAERIVQETFLETP